MNIFQYMKKSVFITAILSIVIGIIFLVNPLGATNFIAKAIGAIVILAGAISVITYIRESNYGFRSSGSLIVGILLIAVGAFLVIYSGVTLTLLGFVIAVYITVDGVINLDSAIAMGRAHVRGWGFHLVIAIALVAVGVMLLVRPFDAVSASATVFGVVLLVDGIVGLISAIRLNRVEF